jgi:hypothetical protein
MRRAVPDVHATPLASEEKLNNTTSGNQVLVRLDVAPAGDVLAAWQGPDANSNGIFARLVAANNPAGAYAGPFRAMAALAGLREKPGDGGSADPSSSQTLFGPVDRILVSFSQNVLDSSFTGVLSASVYESSAGGRENVSV